MTDKGKIRTTEKNSQRKEPGWSLALPGVHCRAPARQKRRQSRQASLPEEKAKASFRSPRSGLSECVRLAAALLPESLLSGGGGGRQQRRRTANKGCPASKLAGSQSLKLAFAVQRTHFQSACGFLPAPRFAWRGRQCRRFPSGSLLPLCLRLALLDIYQ